MSRRHVVSPSRPCPTLVRALVTGLLLPLVSPSAGSAQERGPAEGFFASLMAGGRTTNGLNVNDEIELTGGASVGVRSPRALLELRYTGYRIDRSDGFHGVSVGLFALAPDSARSTAAYYGPASAPSANSSSSACTSGGWVDWATAGGSGSRPRGGSIPWASSPSCTTGCGCACRREDDRPLTPAPPPRSPSCAARPTPPGTRAARCPAAAGRPPRAESVRGRTATS